MGNEHPLSRQEMQAFRQRIADLGVEIAFGVAELCKPDNLQTEDLTFETVVRWKDLRRELVSRGREINRDRRQRFSDHRFVLMPIPMAEIRPWPRAGDLPVEWTDQYSIAELGRMLRDGDIIVPDNALRLRDMLEFATDPDRLERLRSTLPIALPEFHTHRKELDNTPWTLDDGSHRGLVLAVHGDTHLWCLAGFKRQEGAGQVTDKLLTDLAGVHPDDRAALDRYLAQWEGRWRLAAAATPQDLSALILGQLPDLPIRREDGAEVMQRVEVRRAHAEIARSAGLFRPTDNHGRILATLVALAEFARTRGAGAFNQRDVARQETQLEHGSEQDAARSAAGGIALAALNVGGVSSCSFEGTTLRSYPAVLDLVRDLASDRPLDKNADHVHAISAGAPALSDLTRASDQNGARPWLGRQLSRACIVAADAAQVHQDWACVQYRSTQAIAAILHHAGPPTPHTKFDDLMGLVRGLNRLGVSHRARWQEGLWRVEQAALHHEAAIKLLSWCPKPPKSSREWSEYMLNCFTALTNLASAWTEHTHASINSGLHETDDKGFRRARTLVMALRDHEAADRQVSAHAAMHGTGRECSRNPARSLTCLPDRMLDITVSVKNSNYYPWDWILRNDLAEINWRIGIHAMHDRRQSRWTPPGQKRPASPRLCLQNGLYFHTKAINDLTELIGQSQAGSTISANMQYWRWRHLTNLRNKLDELARDGHGSWLELGHEPRKELRRFDSITPNEYPAQQIATLDAYNEKDHEITLWTGPQDS
jgi:hypothetical protein